jgi:hypothetical protein
MAILRRDNFSFKEMTESLFENGEVSDYIKKFGMKMHGSSMETAKGWVDGIGGCSSGTKAKILKGIISKGMVKESESLDEKGLTVAGLSDEKLKKLHGQMKDEQLSAAAASQFRLIVKELKKRGVKLSEAKLSKKGQKYTWDQINTAMTVIGYGPKIIIKLLSAINKVVRDKTTIVSDKDSLTRVKWQKSSTWESAECLPLEEGSTEDAAGTLRAILGMFKDHHDNDIYKMGKGIQDYYKREGSFAPKHAKWIWKTSVALFKN